MILKNSETKNITRSKQPKMKLIFLALLFPITITAQIVNIPDANFKNALVNEPVAIINGIIGLQDADTNNDGEIQLAEALVVTELHVQDQNISSMEGLDSFENIVKLLCFDNNLNEIDLSQNVLLTELWVNQNNLSSLDVTMLPDLDWLSSSDNLLTQLDVSQNPELRIFRTSRNQLTEMNVSNNSLLEHFWCSDNQVSALNISDNPAITNFTGKGNPQLVTLNVRNGNNANMTRMWAFDNPNLECILVDDETVNYPTCEIGSNTGWCKDPGAIYSEDPSECNLSITTSTDLTFQIVPNPAQGMIEIITNQPFLSIEISSISGQQLLATNQKSIDISILPAGIFIIAIRNSDNQVSFKKLVKSDN